MQSYLKQLTEFSESKGRAVRMQNVKHYCELIDRVGRAFEVEASFGISPKIMLFPEASFAGYPPLGLPLKEWIKCGCTQMPGEETDLLAEKAKQFGIYIGGNSYEAPDDWPGCYFNCSFIIGPKGKVVLKYRRIQSLWSGITPHDILDDYVKKDVPLFPVLDTKLGRIAIFPCGEINFPEIARCFMLNGAEVFLHTTGEPRGEVEWFQEMGKRSRAYENKTYLASANRGNPDCHGGSAIFDYNARVLARANTPGETYISAIIDIDALRRIRNTWGYSSFPARLRLEVYASSYQKVVCPANRFLRKPRERLTKFGKIPPEIRKNLVKNKYISEIEDTTGYVDITK